ncbi:MAG: response regulator [Pseudomonadota bacterium]
MQPDTVKRIFVKVFGFSDLERHSLNSVFRLSQARSVAYALWTPESTIPAEVLLLDGDSWEASLELANPELEVLRLVWVGEHPPAHAWRVFERPLHWSAVMDALDSIYAPSLLEAAHKVNEAALDAHLDFDLPSPHDPHERHADDFLTAPATLPAFLATAAGELDFDIETADHGAITAPASGEPHAFKAPGSDSRVLVIDAEAEVRLYWRARLALAGMVFVDEAAGGQAALDLLRSSVYKLVIVDLDVRDMRARKLLKALTNSVPPIQQLVVTREGLAEFDKLMAWFAGANGTLDKPMQPVRVKRLLEKLQSQI